MKVLAGLLALGLAPGVAVSAGPPSDTPAKRPAKTYTDADLSRVHKERSKAQPAEEIHPTRATDDAAVRRELDAEGAERARREARWRRRAEEGRAAVRAAEIRVAQLESEANRRFTDLLQTCGQAIGPRASLARAMDDFEQAKSDLATAKQALEDLEEEARRSSIPPGWLRER
jgi:hypothetical protein